MHSNCCCSCSFEFEIIKIGRSSHKMFSNNIVNFQESTTILNARTKKYGNLLNAPRIFINSKRRGKMEQILLVYDLPKETVTAIIMLNKKKRRVKVCSLEGDTDVNVVPGVLQGGTLTPYLFIIY